MYLQWSWMSVWLPPASLFDELTEKLVLKLWMSQTHLQRALSQRDVVVDGRGIDRHVNEELTRLEIDQMWSPKSAHSPTTLLQ